MSAGITPAILVNNIKYRVKDFVFVANNSVIQRQKYLGDFAYLTALSIFFLSSLIVLLVWDIGGSSGGVLV